MPGFEEHAGHGAADAAGAAAHDDIFGRCLECHCCVCFFVWDCGVWGRTLGTVAEPILWA